MFAAAGAAGVKNAFIADHAPLEVAQLTACAPPEADKRNSSASPFWMFESFAAHGAPVALTAPASNGTANERSPAVHELEGLLIVVPVPVPLMSELKVPVVPNPANSLHHRLVPDVEVMVREQALVPPVALIL